MNRIILIPLLTGAVLLAGCAREPVQIESDRGGVREEGPMAMVFPSGEEAKEARHGLWQGLSENNQVLWEVRYLRGVPTGPYREWNEQGALIATWPYNWQGELDGWARWFENGEPVFKYRIDLENQPKFDPVGAASKLQAWAETQAEIEAETAESGPGSDES